ncbi:unnamed protein product [Peronospora belbahrii]|uniref:Peptidase C1A papain C-terminal domain-containing protein n=1 Tax=Peronospora belbahrii TaxID=622444 RepID=A0ABN8CWN1_9STRA|nr:unnamed protein product [Peronospora belbahrii]
MAKSYGTETIDFAREQDAFIEHPVRCNRPSRNLWGAMIFVTVVGLAGFTYVGWTMHNSLVTQQVAIATMQQQLDAMYSAILVDKETTWNSKTFKEFPTKFVVDYVTPLKTQDERGTCWDFATVAVLENTYRQQGIAQGWMQEDEYMAISEQAYGAEVLRLCAGPPDSPQQVACLIPGNGVWKNTTEVCPALTREKRKVNPLSLKLKKMETLMDEVSIKRAMVKDRRAMTLTTATPYTTHYYPCIGDFANEDRCKPASISCTLCPPKLSMTTCCVPIEKGESYNMNGEFITSHVMNIEGGHVMTLVGYNDLYRTKQGYTGGYILKNSWFDGIHPALGPRHARGSHSLKYWLQEITEWEEASMCPNSYNPENWYQCGNTAEVIDSRYDGGGDAGLNIPLPMKRSSTVRGGIESCLSKETELYAKVNLQPLHLHCTDSSLCVVSNEYTYFVRNTTQWGDHMLRMCLFEYNTMTSTSSEVCFPPLLAQKIAYVLSPVQEEVHENDPDVCGFYFYPYQVQEHYKTQFGNFYVNNFDIEWQAQSYVANKVLYPDLDYHDVIESTYQQRQYEFIGPLPFAHVIAKKDLPSV